MFIGAEVRLDVGFNAAQARLANLAHGGLLRHASDEAYSRWGAELARVGPLGAAPGMSGFARTGDRPFEREMIREMEPVTNQVTTTTGSRRHSTTYPDTGIPLNCGNQP